MSSSITLPLLIPVPGLPPLSLPVQTSDQFIVARGAISYRVDASILSPFVDVTDANKVLAGPVSGADAVATFRNLVADDIPGSLNSTLFGLGLANNLTVAGAATTAGPTITATGSDTNIDVRAVPKGNGVFESKHARFGTENGAPADFGSETVLKVSANPTYAGTVTPASLLSMSIAGTIASGQAFYNQWSIDNDTADASGAGGGGASGFIFSQNISAGAVGGRSALGGILRQVGVSAPGVGLFYTGGGFQGIATASAGGTAGFENDRGNMFGGLILSRLESTAGLHWTQCIAQEFNVGIASGAGALDRVGVQIVQLSDGATQGSRSDVGLGFTTQTNGVAAGWDYAITIGLPHGWWPMDAAGTIIGTYPATIVGGPARVCAYGIDWSAITFSTAFLKSTGFLVDGSGNVEAVSADIDGEITATTVTAVIVSAPRLELGPTSAAWTTGSGAPGFTQPKGSLYSRIDGGVGSTLYVSQGAGTWNPVAGV